MKEYPIIFSSEMVKAILEDRKSVTRRVVKPQPDENGVSYMKNAPLDWESIFREPWSPWKWDTEEGESISKNCPYGEPGDVLWVRETWFNDADFGEPPIYIFKAGNENYPRGSSPWKPSIHMPRTAARIFLKVTDVRVERIQDITKDDIKAEGIQLGADNGAWNGWHDRFQSLWEKINGPGSWHNNPWVWVIEFERIQNVQ